MNLRLPNLICILLLCLAVSSESRAGKGAARRQLSIAPSIHEGCKLGQFDAVLKMLRGGMDPNIRDEKDATALHYAVKTTNFEIIQALIEAGALLDSQDRAGDTPLHISCRRGDLEKVRILCASFASVDIANAEGLTPYDVALEVGDGDIIAELEQGEAYARSGRSTPPATKGRTHSAAAHPIQSLPLVSRAKRLRESGHPHYFDDKGGPADHPALQMEYVVTARALDQESIAHIERRIAYTFTKKARLAKALTSRDVDPNQNYERYEFLGDKILDFALSELLMHRYKGIREGSLSVMRSSLVRQEALAALCLYLGLDKFIQTASPVIPISVLADIIESVVAAIYKDGGPEAAREFIQRYFGPMLKDDCIKEADSIIKIAAKEQNYDIDYLWTADSCAISFRAGSGLVTEAGFHKRTKKAKECPVRLTRYVAEKEFIEQVLPPQYVRYLVRLATDRDYQPL